MPKKILGWFSSDSFSVLPSMLQCVFHDEFTSEVFIVVKIRHKCNHFWTLNFLFWGRTHQLETKSLLYFRTESLSFNVQIIGERENVPHTKSLVKCVLRLRIPVYFLERKSETKGWTLAESNMNKRLYKWGSLWESALHLSCSSVFILKGLCCLGAQKRLWQYVVGMGNCKIALFFGNLLIKMHYE